MSTSLMNEFLERTRSAGKTYEFDDGHDTREPVAIWFQESPEGLVLFIVFYSQACRWSRCAGCNLPSKSSQSHVDFRALMAQVDAVFRDPMVVSRRATIQKVIASNNGSMLDQVTFSSTALMYFLAQLNLHLPKLAVLCLESRPEYIEVEELEFMSRALAEGETPTRLELAIGFEAFDDQIRNGAFNKGMSLAAVENLVARMARYGFDLKCYFMQKPTPGLTDQQAVDDICSAMDYLDGLSRSSGVRINMHLNPTYVARGTPLEQAFREGKYVPPRLGDVARAARHSRGKKLSVFIGLHDEGLAVPGGSFIRPGDEALVERLELFNRTQDHGLLEPIGTNAH